MSEEPVEGIISLDDVEADIREHPKGAEDGSVEDESDQENDQ